MLVAPETFAARTESITEQLFVERSLTENRFWLRIMKEHALFLGERFNRNDTVHPTNRQVSLLLRTTGNQGISSLIVNIFRRR